jgi:hypothetical protein
MPPFPNASDTPLDKTPRTDDSTCSLYYTFSTTRTRLFLRPVLDFFYDRNDPHKISKKFFFCDHYLHIQQKCIILADGFIELSSKYANSSFSEKDLMLFFSFQFISV